MTTEQIEAHNPLVLDEGETLDDLMPEIAGELLRLVTAEPAEAARQLRLIGDQLRRIGGVGDTVAVIIGGNAMNDQGFKTEAGARRFIESFDDADWEDYFVTEVTDCGSECDELLVGMYGVDTWLEANNEE